MQKAAGIAASFKQAIEAEAWKLVNRSEKGTQQVLAQNIFRRRQDGAAI